MTPQSQEGLYTGASLDERTHELIVKAINVSPAGRPAVIDLSGINASGTAKVTTLESADLNAENSFDQPKNVAPKLSTMDVNSSKISVQLNPYSLSVYRVPLR